MVLLDWWSVGEGTTTAAILEEPYNDGHWGKVLVLMVNVTLLPQMAVTRNNDPLTNSSRDPWQPLKESWGSTEPWLRKATLDLYRSPVNCTIALLTYVLHKCIKLLTLCFVLCQDSPALLGLRISFWLSKDSSRIKSIYFLYSFWNTGNIFTT